jgi:hypothetical protein
MLSRKIVMSPVSRLDRRRSGAGEARCGLSFRRSSPRREMLLRASNLRLALAAISDLT